MLKNTFLIAYTFKVSQARALDRVSLRAFPGKISAELTQTIILMRPPLAVGGGGLTKWSRYATVYP